MAKKKEDWEIYQDNRDKWRWKRIATNGIQIGASSQGYASKSYCKQNAIKHGME